MDWWQWVIVALFILVLLTVCFYGIQIRRRRGGIIAQRHGRPGNKT